MLAGCLFVALLIGALPFPLPPIVIALEFFLTIGALFLFGSIRYRMSNNALTYGALIIIFATFYPHSPIQKTIQLDGLGAFLSSTFPRLFSLSYLERLMHLDTMLFILGLTFFVSVIAQTRMLEAISIQILTRTRGQIFKTVVIILALVSIASGIMDGVSMIGLTIRVLVFILIMAKVPSEDVRFLVMVSVVVTTVCGMWLAYGEPPNLIMKSNLNLPDAFFLHYTLPLAVLSFLIVVGFLYRRLKSHKIAMTELDILEQHIADIRFHQVSRLGRVMELDEMLQTYENRLGGRREAVWGFYHAGHHPIEAMILAEVEEAIVREWINDFLGPEWITPTYNYYLSRAGEDYPEPKIEIFQSVLAKLQTIMQTRMAAARWGKIAFIPFILLLIGHAVHHRIPLFLSSTVGFLVAFIGMRAEGKIQKRIIDDGVHEYKEYLFLFPLFLSITMLGSVGFFDYLKMAIADGVIRVGAADVAAVQLVGSAMLSAMLDNNVVADFASRAIEGMPDLFLFAAAQIAGYATGGSLTHIGSAQSVIAYAYILRYVDRGFTPIGWVRAIWKLIGALLLALAVALYIIARAY